MKKIIPPVTKKENYIPYPYHKTWEENEVEAIFNPMSSVAGAWNKIDRLKKAGKRARMFYFKGKPFCKIGHKTFEVRDVAFADGSMGFGGVL